MLEVVLPTDGMQQPMYPPNNQLMPQGFDQVPLQEQAYYDEYQP